MIKTIAASQAGKALMLCVCPVAATTIALKVPAARDAIHRVTAPEKAKPKRSRLVHKPAQQVAKSDAVCPDPAPTQVTGGNLPLFPAPEGGLTMLPETAEPQLLTQAGSYAFAPERVGTFASTSSGGGSSGAPSVLPFGVPEPNVWVQTIFGFGIAGAAIRRALHKRPDQSLNEGISVG